MPPCSLIYQVNQYEQGGIFRSLHGKSQAGRKENLKKLSEFALLLETSEYEP